MSNKAPGIELLILYRQKAKIRGPGSFPIGGIVSPPSVIGNFDLELDCSNADWSNKDTAADSSNKDTALTRYIVVDSSQSDLDTHVRYVSPPVPSEQVEPLFNVNFNSEWPKVVVGRLPTPVVCSLLTGNSYSARPSDAQGSSETTSLSWVVNAVNSERGEAAPRGSLVNNAVGSFSGGGGGPERPSRYPHVCNECDKGYRSKRGLGQHIKRAHPLVSNLETVVNVQQQIHVLL